MALVAIGMLLAVNACSWRSLGIKYADKVAMHELDAYFDINEAQEDQFKPLVLRHIAALKSELVPKVRCDLQAFSNAWSRGLTAADTEKLLNDYDEWRIIAATRIAADAGRFLATLGPEQVNHLARKLKDSNEAFARLAAMDAKDFEDAEMDDIMKSVRTWLGALSPKQEQELRMRHPPLRAKWQSYYEQRLAAQENLINLARNGQSPTKSAAQILIWTRMPYILRNTSAAAGQQRRLDYQQQILDVYELAEPSQKQHALEVIKDLIDDLGEGKQISCTHEIISP